MVGLPAILEALFFWALHWVLFQQIHHEELDDISRVFCSGASPHYFRVEAKLYRSITHEISARNYD